MPVFFIFLGLAWLSVLTLLGLPWVGLIILGLAIVMATGSSNER